MSGGAVLLAWMMVLPAAQRAEPQDLSRFVSRETVSLQFYSALEGEEAESAQASLATEDYVQAARLFEKAFTRTGKPIALFHAGNAYYRADANDDAIRVYRAAIDAGLGAMPDLHYNLANAHYAKYQRKEAIAAFERVLQLTSDGDAMAHYHLGIILDGEGRHEEAIRHYLQTIELTGDTEPMAHQHLGVAHFMKRDYAKAVTALETYRRQVPDDAGGRLNLGIALRYAGRTDEAVKELKSAIADSRDSLPDAHYQLARILTERKEYRLALEHFESARARGIRSPRTDAEFDELRKLAGLQP